MEIKINSCRICLQNVGVIPIFYDHEGEIFAEMISSVFNIDVIFDVLLPDTVCTECMKNVKNAIKTKENIISSEAKLDTHFQINNTITEPARNIVQINDEHDAVKSKLIGLEAEQIDIEKFEDIHSSQDCEAVSTKYNNKNGALRNKVSYFTDFPEMYDCGKCEFKTNTYKRLIFHMRTHSDMNLYECEQCGKEFKERSRYLVHAAIHLPHKYYKCKHCSKEFKGRSNLNQHLLIHKTERDIPCPYCDKSFCHTKSLKQHLLIHNEKNVICEICGMKFRHTSFLNTHIATHHGHAPGRTKKRNKDFTLSRKAACEFCGKMLSVVTMKRHVNAIHFGERPFQCSYCDKAFATAAILSTHVQYHFNSKHVKLDPKTMQLHLKFKCDECDKAFSNSTFLRLHKVLHSGVKEHVCSHCQKGFALKVYLNRHVRLVHNKTDPRNFICTVCGKVSADLSGLNSHMLAHTGETPFHCKFCDSKFRYAKSLRLHVRNKHGTKVSKDSEKSSMEINI